MFLSALNIISHFFPTSWHIEALNDRMDEDFHVEVVSQGEDTGLDFAIKILCLNYDRISANQIIFAIPSQLIKTLMESQIPAMLISYDPHVVNAYYRWVDREMETSLNMAKKKWSTRVTIPLSFTKENQLHPRWAKDIILYLADRKLDGDPTIKDLFGLRTCLNVRVIRGEVKTREEVINNKFKQAALKEFKRINLSNIHKLLYDERYRELAFYFIRRNDEEMRDAAFEFYKTLYFFYLIEGDLFMASHANVFHHDSDLPLSDALEMAWWEQWIKKPDLQDGIQNIHRMPRINTYERQFIHLLEKNFGKDFNRITIDEYQDHWMQLPYGKYKFLLWLQEKMDQFDGDQDDFNKLIEILIPDFFLRRRMMRDAENVISEDITYHKLTIQI